MNVNNEVKILLQKLVGECSTGDSQRFDELTFFQNGSVIGYSQFNEILLLLGFDRVTQSFFQYLVDGTTEYNQSSVLSSKTQLETGILRFRKLAILLYANVKYGFKELARNSDELKYQLDTFSILKSTSYAERHIPILKIEPIKPEETYLLGYVIEDKILRALKKDPSDEVFRILGEKRIKVVEQGKRNHVAYLTSDYMDVYVATSMRLEHEYLSVNRTVLQLETEETLKDLSLRIFDPTQAYCKNRIDKGLCEALMLKRAKCTVYLAQESDTLGKDSELASTLAQGKPVIALVPTGDKEFVDSQIKLYHDAYPAYDNRTIIIELLKAYNPSLAWTKEKEGRILRDYIDGKQDVSEKDLLEILYDKAKEHYDKRYNTLVKVHPLGIQVDLETGVATGVLVARDICTCAKLIRSHVLGEVEYDISEEEEDGKKYYYLKEKISGCIYRAVTGDIVLTNSYWNFYLNEPNN